MFDLGGAVDRLRAAREQVPAWQRAGVVLNEVDLSIIDSRYRALNEAWRAEQFERSKENNRRNWSAAWHRAAAEGDAQGLLTQDLERQEQKKRAAEYWQQEMLKVEQAREADQRRKREREEAEARERQAKQKAEQEENLFIVVNVSKTLLR